MVGNTHTAAWLGIANAQLGDGDKAWQIFDIINPIRRTSDLISARHYAREPYFLSGDVAGAGVNTGCGGWSWYTGAASWSWQLAVHEILGVTYAPGCVIIKPCLPSAWTQVEVRLQPNGAVIELYIQAFDPASRQQPQLIVDDQVVEGNRVEFPEAGALRKAQLFLT
jgi:cyclic beta-1,2-glucan synthetase